MYETFQIKMFTLHMALLLLNCTCTCKCITISCVFYFAFFGGMQPLPNQVNRQIFKHTTHTHTHRDKWVHSEFVGVYSNSCWPVRCKIILNQLMNTLHILPLQLSHEDRKIVSLHKTGGITLCIQYMGTGHKYHSTFSIVKYLRFTEAGWSTD